MPKQVIANWKNEIGVAWLVKQTMMGLDTENIFPYHMPELAASDGLISQAEESLGHQLDPRYKEFLKCANGWQAFWQSADIFGTHDLVEGFRKDAGEFLLSMVPDEVLSKSLVKRGDLLPISATRLDKDLFVIARPSSSSPGTVIWFAGEEVERFSTFDDYFLAMVEYSRHDVKWLSRRRKPHE